ncbi:MAG: hypothetical protein ABSC25_13855 [Roseiarcus sp.]
MGQERRRGRTTVSADLDHVFGAADLAGGQSRLHFTARGVGASMKADRNRNAASVDAIEALVDASERQVDRLFAQDGDPQRNAGFDVVRVSSGWRGDDDSGHRISLERGRQGRKGFGPM